MMGPVTAKRGYIVPVILKDSVHLRKVRDVILGIILLDRRDTAAFVEVCDGLVKILVVFFSEDSFEFLAVVAGTGLETFVTVKNVEDLEFHAGKTAGHYENYKITNNIKHTFLLLAEGGCDSVTSTALPKSLTMSFTNYPFISQRRSTTAKNTSSGSMIVVHPVASSHHSKNAPAFPASTLQDSTTRRFPAEIFSSLNSSSLSFS